MGIIADFFVKMFGSIVSAIWQFVVYFQAWCISALTTFLTTFIVAVLPASLAANVLPYVTWIEAINQWVPLSEAVAFGIGSIVFSVTWAMAKACMRFLTLGLVGKG